MAESGDRLRVHLAHQSFADYVGGLVDGLTAPERVLGGVGRTPPGVDLRVTTLLSGTSPRAALRSAGADHHTVALPRFRDPRSPLKAWAAVRAVMAEPADVVHWQAAGNPWIDLAFSRLMGRRPTVVTVHDMEPHPGDRNVLPLTFAAIGRLVRRADRVVVHAPHIRDQAVAAGAAPDRVVVLPHGELGSRYRPPDQLPLAPRTDPVVLFFGRAQGYKGLDVLVEAMDAVVERVPGARLVVAGSGPTIDELFPPGSTPPPWCDLRAGSVPDGEVAETFGAASVVALPYREASQSGVAALAAGFGRPVVASAVPGLSDIVDDGVTGRLVRPGSAAALADGLVELLADRDLAARMGEGAAEAASTRLSWPVVAADLVAVYHEVVSSRRPGGWRSVTNPTGPDGR